MKNKTSNYPVVVVVLVLLLAGCGSGGRKQIVL